MTTSRLSLRMELLYPCSQVSENATDIAVCESELIQAAKQGNLDSFNQLVLMYEQDVFNLALWMLKDHQAAEDITQETFFKAFRWVHELKGGSFRSWLFRVARNACIDETRRLTRQNTIPLLPLDSDGDEIETPSWLADENSIVQLSENKELKKSLRGWIQELHSSYSHAVVLVDVMRINYEEAANIMKVPIGTVKSRVARGRMYLRARLRNFQADPIHRGEGRMARARE